MNLNNLKPAWEQYKFQNSLEGFSSHAVLEFIESQEAEMTSYRTKRILANVAMFLLLMICCQGG